jgi:hypothetical protein
VRCAVVPASLLAGPPPFRRHPDVPRTSSSWAPEDWCGNDAAVAYAEKRVATLEKSLERARARLEAAKKQREEAEAKARSLGYALIKR